VSTLGGGAGGTEEEGIEMVAGDAGTGILGVGACGNGSIVLKIVDTSSKAL
jgi:hypothetical protein